MQNGLRPAGQWRQTTRSREGTLECLRRMLYPAATFPAGLCSNPCAATYYVVTVDKLFKLQEFQLPHLQNGYQDILYLL